MLVILSAPKQAATGMTDLARQVVEPGEANPPEPEVYPWIQRILGPLVLSGVSGQTHFGTSVTRSVSPQESLWESIGLV